jgi:GNAT superfamily N-acetyltransferase
VIDDFARAAWVDNHDRLAVDVDAGLARFARWLGRRAKPKDEVVPTQRWLSVSRCPKRSRLPEAAVGADAQYCLGEYYRELQERFDGGFDAELSLLRSLDEFAPPCGTFLLVRLNGEPVGCGGLKPISKEAAYLKRMWIAPGARGLGVARRLLSALEDSAQTMGYSVMRLETNRSLIEA